MEVLELEVPVVHFDEVVVVPCVDVVVVGGLWDEVEVFEDDVVTDVEDVVVEALDDVVVVGVPEEDVV